MKTQRKASAEWHGGLKDGKGALTTGSGVLRGDSLLIWHPV